MPVPPKVAYIEGRPQGHPTHAAYARAVNSDFYHVDFRLRYHDVPHASRLRRYLSWLVCALTFPGRRQYQVFLSEEAYFMLGLMRRLRLMSRRQKLIAMMGSHTLYYLHTGMYSGRTTRAFIRLFKQYDAFICEGPIQTELLKGFLKDKPGIKIYQIFNGSPAARFNKLIEASPALDSMNMLTIAAVPTQGRMFYKGIDLMLEAFNKVKPALPQLTFTIVGECDGELMDQLLDEKCPQYKKDVLFTGQSSDLSVELKTASLYLHTARGEAWGISVTEAMAAAVPAIVSEWTGSKEVVSKVLPGLVVPLDANAIAEKIVWYYKLDAAARTKLSEKSREVAMFYREENAIENFRQTFEKACAETTEKGS
jgi:glycosyltransferase involved in cell wall biosynthesis